MILKNGKRVDGIADALPIGSVIEYSGTDIPDGWEIVTEEETKESANTYDLEETLIGTWMGQPLYRKVLYIVPTGQYVTTYEHNANLKDLVYLGGYYKRTGSDYNNPLPCTYPNWEAYVYDFRTAHFSLRFSDNAWNSGVEYCYIIIEYTKNN